MIKTIATRIVNRKFYVLSLCAGLLILSGASSSLAQEGLATRVFPVRFQTVAGMEAIIRNLYPGIIIVPDAQRQVLIVKAPPATLDQMATFISEYDVTPKIILVEGMVVKVNMTEAFRLGNRFDNTISVPHPNEFLDVRSAQPTAPNVQINIPTRDGNSITWSLDALVQNGLAEIVLKPHLTFVSGTRGKFTQITNVPQVTVSAQLGPNVQFFPVGLTLTVGGHYINPAPGEAGKIMLSELEITDGQTGAQVPGFPTFFTDEVKINTTQIVDDGQLIILGGSVEKEITKQHSKLPILGEVPLSKYFFRHTNEQHNVIETLIFLRISAVEPEGDYQRKAAQYLVSKDLRPPELGGRENDSLRNHPWTTATWSSKLIYNPDGVYLTKIYQRVPQAKQVETARLFRELIVDRIPVQYDWNNPELLHKLVTTDPGLPDAFKELASRTGMTPMEALVTARHIGTITDVVFEFYEKYVIDRGL